MNPFEMVVLIVAIVTLGRIVGGKNGLRRWRRHDVDSHTEADNERLRDEIKDLKERIAVLERLATDTHSAAALDREIEKLR